MTPPLPDEAPEIARRISAAFTSDQALAVRLNEAAERLERANSNLWDGLHPDALSLLYDHTLSRRVADEATMRSSVTAQIADARRAGADAHGVETVALRAVQEIHWTIHRAFAEYATTAEERRQLAAQVGEDIRSLVDVLTAAGWSEQDARNADVAQLAQSL